MNFKKYIYIAAVALGMGVTFAACSDDDLDPNSIFDDTKVSLTLHRRLISSTSSATTASACLTTAR